MNIRSLSKVLSAVLIGIFCTASITYASSFSDLPANPLYSSHITSLHNSHFITGDTVMGTPTGKFRPDETINRAEFTKITAIIRLAELFGINEKWNGRSEHEITELINDKLRYFYKCNNTDTPECSVKQGADIKGVCNVCTSIGGKPFTDVPEKKWGCEKEGICDPWFTQYIYYAVAKGFIKGYTQTHSFKPYNSILRIHALKMIMTDNGTADDNRYRSLSSLALSRNSSYPKCLKGAEDFIRENNGGSTSDSEDLLSFTLLADRLDLFGNNCQIFTENKANTPKQRADFLQKPLTRKESTRYYTLTTSYSPISADPESDITINTALQNKNSSQAFSYIAPEYGKADEPLSAKKTETPKAVQTNTQKTAQTYNTAVTDNKPEEFPVSDYTISIKQSFQCNGKTIKAGTPFQTYGITKSTDGKRFMQYISYDGHHCTISCDILNSPECKEAIIKESGLVGETKNTKSAEKTENDISKFRESYKKLEAGFPEEYLAYNGIVTINDNIHTITKRLNKYYGTKYTPQEIAKMNGVKDYNNLNTGAIIKIGTLDGWKPPANPKKVDVNYWNSLSVDKQKILHYHRNAYQFGQLPKNESELNPYLWQKIEGDAIAHNLGTSGNKDYRGQGVYEGMQAIYDIYGNLVTTPENIGTYDYAPPGVLTLGDHQVMDIRPWLIWGNSPQDPTIYRERLESLGKITNFFLESLAGE